jgi:glutamate-ammonia-ligase adenylyltransferase
LKRLEQNEALRDRLPAIRAYLDTAADPEAVVVGLQRMLEAGADPLGHLEGWLKLIDISPSAVETLVKRPGLARDIAGRRYDRAEFEDDLDEALRGIAGLEGRMEHLRAVRVDETLRIAWQDVVEGADLTVVTRRISDLAEIVLERVLEEVNEDLARRFGRAWHEGEPVGVAVIAMGKLGGAELNYSSDIDLIFLYGKDGETDGGEAGKRISNREYFHRLTERVTREGNAVTGHGRMYRVDLRLRPEGASGSLARSLASTLAYYRRIGETWERQALLKARAICGDRALGDEFVHSVRDWVYGRGLDFGEIGAIKRLKERMESITAGRGDERHEVKLGYGGIRDVEYTIQFLQLLHGARAPEVRHHNSLTALRLLEKSGAILARERDVLDDAYRFLRMVEHRLQLVQHAQVHRIPEDEADVGRLARRCGFESSDAFLDAYRERAAAVRAVFERLFRNLFAGRDKAEVEETDLILHERPDRDALAAVLARHRIKDAARGIGVVEQLARESSPLLAGSPRTRKFLANLFPRLLGAVEKTPEPIETLARIEAITSRVGARGTLYESLAADGRLLRMLVDLTGHSAFLTNVLVRAPGVLDQLVDAVATAPERGLTSFEDIPVASVPSAPDPARILSDYKNLELLRIGLRDVRAEQDLPAVSEDLTRLAEVIVRLCYERARLEAGSKAGDVVVVALGKFGTREMLYGSDLDLAFFARDGDDPDAATAVARRLNALLSTPTAHGKLYEADLRLRPGGVSGPLVTTPNGFADYFARGLGQTWERMSYTRARPVAGPPTLCEEVAAAIQRTIYPPGFTADDARAMAEMREKLAAAGSADSIKRARAGGAIDVEFAAQMHALKHDIRAGSTAERIKQAAADGLLKRQAAADVLAAYRFLLALESRIRIVADLPEDRLPKNPRPLALRLGYIDTETTRAEESLREEYEYHRSVAARAFHNAIAAFGAV